MVTISGCRAAGSVHFLISDFRAGLTCPKMQSEHGETATTCTGGCAFVMNPRSNAAISQTAAVNITEQKVELEADYSPDESIASLFNENQCEAAQLELA